MFLAGRANKRKNGGSYFQGLAPITGVTLLHVDLDQ